ncbi:MAG: GDSL-type esterase/lipase family protein [Fibrobacter sp.]|uniref:GDSL-type esterase/lipase family protein n=1 Tax=Fibrobacter sp. TaxID=35828 RepID=UPI002A91D75E|nr:GDSL-type esterase/lipase family protein [Fibrobacter sp.]MDY6263602.1 GDSL-type esterase/lipase family protein [Fibrobacter sp.]
MFNKIWQTVVVASMVVAPLLWAKVTIFMLGDSTMQDWADGYYPKQGQGQDFHYWFDVNKAAVENWGKGGMSLGGGGLDKKGNTAVGYYDMFWKHGCTSGSNCIADRVQAGDYVVIQFGINDVSYSNEDFFRSNMAQLVKEVRAKGAYPIIMSPIRRLYYDSPTQIHNSYRGYPALNQSLADSLNVPFIDMSEMVANFMISVGYTYSAQFIFNHATKDEYSNLGSDQADDVHLQMNGANAFGRIITEQMRAHSDPIVKKLGDYMAPMYQVSVKVSPEGADSATSLAAYYPQGMTVMLKTVPKSGKKFLGWYDGNGNKVGAPSRSNVKSPYIHTFVMGSASTQYTAVYEGGTAQKYEGDGKALTSFPTTTPKSLDDVTFVPFTPIEGSTQDTVKIDKDIKKFFDASTPDTAGIGWTQNEWTGFTGEGYYNLDNTNASFAAYKVKFPGAGYVTLAVRYANGGSSDRMFNAYLDHDYLVSAPPTGGWDKWDTAYVVMDAPQGEAELKIMSLTSDGAPNLDAFGFNIEGVCRVSEGCPDVKDTTDSLMEIIAPKVMYSDFARLKGDLLQVNGAEKARVEVFDLRGRLVAKRIVENASEVSLANLVKSTGLYRVVVRSGSEKFNANWVKVK